MLPDDVHGAVASVSSNGEEQIRLLGGKRLGQPGLEEMNSSGELGCWKRTNQVAGRVARGQTPRANSQTSTPNVPKTIANTSALMAKVADS